MRERTEVAEPVERCRREHRRVAVLDRSVVVERERSQTPVEPIDERQQGLADHDPPGPDLGHGAVDGEVVDAQIGGDVGLPHHLGPWGAGRQHLRRQQLLDLALDVVGPAGAGQIEVEADDGVAVVDT